MKATWEESADLKMALKRDPVTAALDAEAAAFLVEADEAYFEVKAGLDFAEPGSWVARALQGTDQGGES